MATKAEVLEAVGYGRGCLGQAALDERVFILRAQDKLAPWVGVRWAYLAEQAGAPQAEVQGALELAKQMADCLETHKHSVTVPD